MLIMKEEKMYPRGSGVVGNVLEVSCKEGTQMNTLRYSCRDLTSVRILWTYNRYIEPSKQVWARPRTSRRGSGEQLAIDHQYVTVAYHHERSAMPGQVSSAEEDLRPDLHRRPRRNSLSMSRG
jgi:hypothetical protein